MRATPDQHINLIYVSLSWQSQRTAAGGSAVCWCPEGSLLEPWLVKAQAGRSLFTGSISKRGKDELGASRKCFVGANLGFFNCLFPPEYPEEGTWMGEPGLPCGVTFTTSEPKWCGFASG